MVIKVDKSEEFIKSGKKLISEYPAQKKTPTERLHDDIREWTSKETS
jgi:hypothetical protein